MIVRGLNVMSLTYFVGDSQEVGFGGSVRVFIAFQPLPKYTLEV